MEIFLPEIEFPGILFRPWIPDMTTIISDLSGRHSNLVAFEDCMDSGDHEFPFNRIQIESLGRILSGSQ